MSTVLGLLAKKISVTELAKSNPSSPFSVLFREKGSLPTIANLRPARDKVITEREQDLVRARGENDKFAAMGVRQDKRRRGERKRGKFFANCFSTASLICCCCAFFFFFLKKTSSAV